MTELPAEINDAKSVLLTGVLPHWGPHQAWELGLAEKLIKAGKEVVISVCNGSRLICPSNSSIPRSDNVCFKCVAKRNHGLSTLNDRGFRAKLALTMNYPINIEYSPWNTVEDVKNIYYESFDVGMAAISTWTEITNKYFPDTELDRLIIGKFIEEGVAEYLTAIELMDRHNPDVIGVFNGRLTHTKSWMTAAEKLGIHYFTYDNGSSHEKLRLVMNSSIHSIRSFTREIFAAWANRSDENYANNLAAKFYTDSASKKNVFTRDFLKHQRSGNLPDWWDPGKRWCTFFLSSLDEFVAVSKEWDEGLYSDQFEGVSSIIRDPRIIMSELNFVIRVHPRMAQINNNDWKVFEGLGNDRVKIISPYSDVDSYELMRNSEKVLTFGSSMGIESVYWNRPSILLKNSFYKDLGGCYCPETHAELIDNILDSDLPAKNSEPALMYGYYLNTYGINIDSIKNIESTMCTYGGELLNKC